MPRWPPLHPDYESALAGLARFEIGYAEALRRLIPLEQQLGVGRPTYWRVRRFLMAERRRLELQRRERRELAAQVVTDLFVGLCPIQRFF
ncbi:MAG TPA: hypothetical protein VF236_00125 [Gaiellaceae bacterium]